MRLRLALLLLLLNPAVASEKEAMLQRAQETREAGDLVASRTQLSRLLEGDSQNNRVQALLYTLDAEIEAQYEAAASRALADAREGRFGEARQALQNLQQRYTGLPWGPAAETRLREVDELEAEARKTREPPEAQAGPHQEEQEHKNNGNRSGRLTDRFSLYKYFGGGTLPAAWLKATIFMGKTSG